MKKYKVTFFFVSLIATNNVFACQNGVGADCPKISPIDSCSSSSSSSCSSDEKFGASSLYSTSGSSRASNTIFKNVVEKPTTTKNQQQQLTNLASGLQLSVADLRYEHADFRAFNNSGDIGGFTASASYDFNSNYSIGALIPYDYLSFDLFEAHRTGFIGYAKGKFSVMDGVEATAVVNGNYIYSDTDYFNNGQNGLGTHTYGGGFNTRLDYDKGGDFLSSLAFSIQYNQDNSNQLDDHQYLVKLSPSVGYRVGDNAVVKLFGAWNNDITHYRTVGNKLKDSEFFDVGVEGAYNISETWQVKGGYKKMLDLTAFDSDAFYLGNSLKF